MYGAALFWVLVTFRPLFPFRGQPECNSLSTPWVISTWCDVEGRYIIIRVFYAASKVTIVGSFLFLRHLSLSASSISEFSLRRRPSGAIWRSCYVIKLSISGLVRSRPGPHTYSRISSIRVAGGKPKQPQQHLPINSEYLSLTTLAFLLSPFTAFSLALKLEHLSSHANVFIVNCSPILSRLIS